ncbi:nucleolin 1-like [Magnolia sinica]|uniref:nucleolin 1-like n=1 Tax=Magnolia sinica TaxID=86752 RepID=UPI002657F929|nr:nucleolin 1-like [Magnolia sinica]
MSKWQMPQQQRPKRRREEFFKGAGEVVDARFASNEEGVFKGFDHVEFATEAAAHKIHFAEHINVFESSSSFQIQNR